MRKLLRPKDILLLLLAGVGDVMEEVRDPLHAMSFAYKNMYGFIPRRYKKHNFLQMVGRSLKTGDIEKITKDGKAYLRLTAAGKDKAKRDFPITRLTKNWNGHWTILIFDIEEKSRVIRDSLREKLKRIGFGMLQESVWITPLPIGEDVWEFIEAIGLKHGVFVMEVLALRLGNPKELARKIWHLDRYEEEYFKIKIEIDSINQLITTYNDRYNKREAKTAKSELVKGKVKGKLIKATPPYLYRLKTKKRLIMRGLLEFIISLPPLPKQLLPSAFLDLGVKY